MSRHSRFSLLALVLVVMGVVLLPLRAVAATSPMLIAYDVAVSYSTTVVVGRLAPVRQSGEAAVHGEARETREYTYDSVLGGYDDARNSPSGSSRGVGATGYDDDDNGANGRELRREGAIYDAPSAVRAAEGFSASESSIAEFLRGLGNTVAKNPLEGVAGAVIDARGSGLAFDAAAQGVSRAIGIARGMIDEITVIVDGFIYVGGP